MTERTLTAMYDTRGAAETARDGLGALGIPADAISIRGSDGDAGAGSAGEDRGFWASLSDLFMPDEDRRTYAEGLSRGSYLLTARVPESTAEQALDVLERSDPIDIDERAASWREGGWTGDQTGAGSGVASASYSEGAGLAEAGTAYAADDVAPTTRQGTGTDRSGADLGRSDASLGTTGDETVQVVEEDLRVGKREVGGGRVRVRSYVTERPVEEQVELRQEHVTIERRPVDRELTSGDAAFQERTIEAVERGEEAVVSKTAHVTEEIGLRKDVERETETIRDTVRKQDVEIEDDRSTTRVGGTAETVGSDRTVR
jgi:uncharacterized protein (TIGR02271 family)